MKAVTDERIRNLNTEKVKYSGIDLFVNVCLQCYARFVTALLHCIVSYRPATEFGIKNNFFLYRSIHKCPRFDSYLFICQMLL